MKAIGKLVFGTQERLRKMKGRVMAAKTAPPGTIYGFEVKRNDHTAATLDAYRGQVLLIVNTASECGFTPQYEGLERLHEKYKDSGLRVLGFPCNDFGAQEPGTDAQIKSFCGVKFGVKFELFAKIAVKGAAQHPLYKFLTTESGHNGAIAWNFSKFLVGRDGRVEERFGPDAEPMSKPVVAAIERLLDAKGGR